jgi:COP9 signalosome complex subunit 1
MRKMASAFNTTINALEDEIMQLILDGQINARIDSHNKVVQKLAFFAIFH